MRLYPAGGVDAVRLPDTWAWVRAAAVSPDRVRGGVASALLAECERLAAAGGATALCLHTTTFMTATHRLAARHGFRRAPRGTSTVASTSDWPGTDLRVLAYAKEHPVIGRRTVLTAALAAGATFAGAGRARPPAAGSAAGCRETLASFGTEPGFPIGHLGITGTARGEVRFRTAAGWQAWRPLPPGDADGMLVPAFGASAYELRGTGLATAIAINTTDGPPVRARAAAGGFAGGRYLSRAGWGADESLRFGPDGTELFPTAYFPVQTLTVHHTATANGDADPAATVRAIYFFHTITQAFGDIGYHLLIDEAGTVYEGRWSGADPVPVFESGRRPGPFPRMSNGAHTGGFNAGNVGVALLGDLTAVGPTDAARRALVAVLATLAGATGREPLGHVGYVNPISGATRTVDTIAAHRDWLATECPGEAFYPMLPDVRQDVALLTGAGRTEESP